MTVHPSRDDRSLGELLSDLSHEMTTLVRQEVRLATAEMSQKATTVGKNLGYLAIGAAVAYAGLLTLVATLVIVLAYFLPLWLSALLVGVVVLGVGYALVQKGLNTLRSMDLAPHQTVATLNEDKQWAKEQLK